MKSFFENNRAYFEKQGVAQKLKKQGPPGESPAGVPSSAREKGKKPGTQMKLGPHHSHPVTIQWLSSDYPVTIQWLSSDY